MQNRRSFTYTKKASGQDLSRLVYAVVFPMGAFFLSIIAVSIFKAFGKQLMTPMLGAMWGFGALCALWMPSHRKSIINETVIMVYTYNATLLALRKLIELTSGVSSQMLMATFGQPITTAAANTIPGYLQNALWISAAMIPLGYLGMEGKRIIQFRRNSAKNKTIEKLRGLRGV